MMGTLASHSAPNFSDCFYFSFVPPNSNWYADEMSIVGSFSIAFVQILNLLFPLIVDLPLLLIFDTLMSFSIPLDS